MDPYEQVIRDHIEAIERHGFALTFIAGGSFIGYTSGLSKHGLPEIAVTLPLAPKLLNGVITDIVDHWKEKGVSLGLRRDLIDDFPVLVSPLDRKRAGYAEWFARSRVIAKRLGYADKLSYVQLVFPDENGYFPDDQQYNQKLRQPLLI